MSQFEPNVLSIKLEKFEGPLDLLFHLIEKHKIDIYDIPIAQLTDQYMEYLYHMNQLNLELASEFLVMAATLLQIKSKLLLPKPAEETEQEEDPRAVLVRRLIEYKMYKSVTGKFSECEAIGSKMYYKLPELHGFKKTYILEQQDADILSQLYSEVLKRNIEKRNSQVKKNVEAIIKIEKVTLRSKIKQVITELKEKVSFKFQEVFNVKKVSKTETVTGFLAILELSKNKAVKLKQRFLFDDIEVKRINIDNVDLEAKEASFLDE